MCAECSLWSNKGGVVERRQYASDNTNRRNPLANSYTLEGIERYPDKAQPRARYS